MSQARPSTVTVYHVAVEDACQGDPIAERFCPEADAGGRRATGYDPGIVEDSIVRKRALGATLHVSLHVRVRKSGEIQG